jgi:hypothetical protein
MHAMDSILWLASDRGLIAGDLVLHMGEPREARNVMPISGVRALAVISLI